jgi:hypothetical protein
MGYAKILCGGPTGRYSIERDDGSTTKTAGLAALNALLVRLDNDINEVQVKITEADAKEAAQLLRVQEEENALILLAQSGLPAGSPELDTAAFTFELLKLRQLQKNHAGIRLRLEALETERALTVKRIAEWNAFQPIETRNAWCVDFTEDGAANSFVGTVDIPGESNLILIAPGCRSWRAGDGTVTVATKLARIATAQALVDKVNASLSETSTLLSTAVLKETALTNEKAAADLAYAINPTLDGLRIKDQAAQALRKQSTVVQNLRLRISALTKQLLEAQSKLAAANALITSASPVISDGFLLAREIMSPAQAYFNAAILPGWQKFKPTYRWGTITAINYDADTANVTVASATSSARSLNVNQGTSLVNVPVEYLDCDADAFEVGDRCVVQFVGQDWSDPRVIGFLDNPKPCIAWPRVRVLFGLSGTFTVGSGTRDWLRPVDGICGDGVIQTAVSISDKGENVTLEFSGAAFKTGVGEPSVLPGMSIESATMPSPLTLGNFTMGIVSAISFENPHPLLDVPSGSSPARRLQILKSGVNVTFRSADFPFTTVSSQEWSYVDDTCIGEARSNPQMDNHITNTPFVNYSTTTLYGPGAIETIPPTLPTIIVAYGSKRRLYTLDAAGETNTSPGWEFVFRASTWLE